MLRAGEWITYPANTYLQELDRMMATPDRWIDEGTMPDGTVGGDGACESVSRRFTRPLLDGTYASVTSYYYPVNVGERWGEEREDADMFDIENMTIITVHTDREDVGGSEIRSEIEYDFPSAMAFPTEDDARTYCQYMAQGESAMYYGDPESW